MQSKLCIYEVKIRFFTRHTYTPPTAFIINVFIWKLPPWRWPIGDETCRSITKTNIFGHVCNWLNKVLTAHDLWHPSQSPRGPRGWGVCGQWLAGIAGSNPGRGYGYLSCVCCVLSGRCLCVKPITRREESYRVCVCVCVCLSVILKPQQWGNPAPLGLYCLHATCATRLHPVPCCVQTCYTASKLGWLANCY